MVKIKGKMATDIVQPEEKQSYTICSARQDVIDRKYDAIRVLMKSTDENDEKAYSATLWLTEMPTPSSLLGSFIEAFEKFFEGKKDAWETDNWLGHTIKILSWRDKRRQIEVVA